MKRIAILSVLALIFLLSGCLSTFYPLYTEKDIVFEPKLVGTWNTGKDGKIAEFARSSNLDFANESPSFQKLAGKAYTVLFKDKSGEELSKHLVILVKIGKYYYLDYYPAETTKLKAYNAFYKDHFIKLHIFYRVKFKGDHAFEAGQFDEGFLRDLIAKKQIRIKHETCFDGSYLITAPTEELQQYVMKYSDTPEAFYDEGITTYNKIK